MTEYAGHPWLVSEAALRERDAAIRAATASAAASQPRALDDASALAFRYYLLFSDPDSTRAAGFEGMDETALFYNRYYWFKRFIKQRASEHGFDAGLEQQVFQLLEAAPATVDWSVIEAIDALAGADGVSDGR